MKLRNQQKFVKKVQYIKLKGENEVPLPFPRSTKGTVFLLPRSRQRRTVPLCAQLQRKIAQRDGSCVLASQQRKNRP